MGPVKRPLPPTPPTMKAGYNEVLKKNLKTFQVNRLERRAAARAEEDNIETLKHQGIAEKSLKDAKQAMYVSVDHNIEAEEARQKLKALTIKYADFTVNNSAKAMTEADA